MRKMTIVAFGAAALAAACGSKEKPVGPPPEVYVAEVLQKDVPIYMELVGQTKGSQDVEIRARVEGYLDKVAFTEGSFVKKGAPALRDRSRSRSRPTLANAPRPTSPPPRPASRRRTTTSRA